MNHGNDDPQSKSSQQRNTPCLNHDNSSHSQLSAGKQLEAPPFTSSTDTTNTFDLTTTMVKKKTRATTSVLDRFRSGKITKATIKDPPQRPTAPDVAEMTPDEARQVLTLGPCDYVLRPSDGPGRERISEDYFWVLPTKEPPQAVMHNNAGCQTHLNEPDNVYAKAALASYLQKLCKADSRKETTAALHLAQEMVQAMNAVSETPIVEVQQREWEAVNAIVKEFTSSHRYNRILADMSRLYAAFRLPPAYADDCLHSIEGDQLQALKMSVITWMDMRCNRSETIEDSRRTKRALGSWWANWIVLLLIKHIEQRGFDTIPFSLEPAEEIRAIDTRRRHDFHYRVLVLPPPNRGVKQRPQYRTYAVERDPRITAQLMLLKRGRDMTANVKETRYSDRERQQYYQALCSHSKTGMRLKLSSTGILLWPPPRPQRASRSHRTTTTETPTEKEPPNAAPSETDDSDDSHEAIVLQTGATDHNQCAPNLRSRAKRPTHDESSEDDDNEDETSKRAAKRTRVVTETRREASKTSPDSTIVTEAQETGRQDLEAVTQARVTHAETPAPTAEHEGAGP